MLVLSCLLSVCRCLFGTLCAVLWTSWKESLRKSLSFRYRRKLLVQADYIQVKSTAKLKGYTNFVRCELEGVILWLWFLLWSTFSAFMFNKLCSCSATPFTTHPCTVQCSKPCLGYITDSDSQSLLTSQLIGASRNVSVRNETVSCMYIILSLAWVSIQLGKSSKPWA